MEPRCGQPVADLERSPIRPHLGCRAGERIRRSPRVYSASLAGQVTSPPSGSSRGGSSDDHRHLLSLRTRPLPLHLIQNRRCYRQKATLNDASDQPRALTRTSVGNSPLIVGFRDDAESLLSAANARSSLARLLRNRVSSGAVPTSQVHTFEPVSGIQSPSHLASHRSGPYRHRQSLW